MTSGLATRPCDEQVVDSPVRPIGVLQVGVRGVPGVAVPVPAQFPHVVEDQVLMPHSSSSGQATNLITVGYCIEVPADDDRQPAVDDFQFVVNHVGESIDLLEANGGAVEGMIEVSRCHRPDPPWGVQMAHERSPYTRSTWSRWEKDSTRTNDGPS